MSACILAICAACSAAEDDKTAPDMGAADVAQVDAPGDAAPPNDASERSLSDLAREAQESYCDLIERCLPEWAYDLQFADSDECVTRQLDRRWWELPDVAADRETYATCAESWENLSCEDWTGTGALPACIVVGTREVGDACVGSEQCKTGLCTVEVDATCGTCGERSEVGDACLERVVEGTTFPYCTTGLQCVSDTCRAPLKEGDACEAGECNPQLSCVEGTCATDAELGDACGVPNTPRCAVAAGQICDPTSMTCIQIELAELGESCADYGACRAPGSCVNGLCVEPAEVGASCDARQRCEGTATCINGTCEVRSCP